MIIVKLKGGLGNQLFQYSIGRCVSLKLNTSLKFNILGYQQKNAGAFELNYFDIPKIDTDITSLLYKPFKYYKENGFHYNDEYPTIKDYTYLDGYWQCEKYFTSIRSILIEDLKVKDEYILAVKEKASEILNANSVAVHVRRGDFLAPHYINNFGILPIDYYNRAIELLQEKVPDLKLYFFSDDVGWVRKHFKMNNGFIISKNYTQTSIEDFYLMSKCRHHIIANSTFSWWPAWLGQYNGKIVIGPKRWFNNPLPNTKDVLPESWDVC